MHIERYDAAKHHPSIKQWCRGWKKAEIPEWWLPPVGFVAPGIIAAFLYVTPGCGLAILEAVISNPDSEHAERQRALDLIDAEVNTYCQCNGIRAVQGQTAVAAVAYAAERNGWTVSKPKYCILAKLISENK